MTQCGSHDTQPIKTVQGKTRTSITPDPGGHRPQLPCAQGRTCAIHEQVQVAALGQVQNRSGGRAAMRGRTTKQEGVGSPTRTQMGKAGAHRRQHPKKERRDKSQTLRLHVPREMTAVGGSRADEEREKDKQW